MTSASVCMCGGGGMGCWSGDGGGGCETVRREEEKEGEEEGRERGLFTDRRTGWNAELNAPGRRYMTKVLPLTLSLMRGSTR